MENLLCITTKAYMALATEVIERNGDSTKVKTVKK